jgi:hypothetical protein
MSRKARQVARIPGPSNGMETILSTDGEKERLLGIQG